LNCTIPVAGDALPRKPEPLRDLVLVEILQIIEHGDLHDLPFIVSHLVSKLRISSVDGLM